MIARTGAPATTGPERFALLASAIAGRPVEVAPTGPGQPAWTDGATVFVDPAAGPGHQVVALAVQSALLNAGSLDPAVLAAIARRPALARRYLAVEGHRALSVQEDLLPTAVRRLIDPSLAGRTRSPAESLAIARQGHDVPDPPAVFGTIRPNRLVTATALPDGPSDGPPGGHRHVPRRRDHGPLQEWPEEDDDTGPAVDLLSSPVGGGGGVGRLLKRLLGEGRSPGGGPPGADSPTHWSRGGARVARTVARSAAAAPSADGGLLAHHHASTYPEWDVHTGGYRRDWCTVVELDPPPTESTPLVLPDTTALRRALTRLGTGLERRRRQLHGDDIDIDAAVEARVQVTAGSVVDEAVYIDTVRRRRDLSVLLLLDVSGSAGQPSATGVPVHQHQRSAAAALTLTLAQLGDPVALYGFRSQGRSAVHVLPVKRFADDLDASVLRRLGGLAPAAYTRLGAAIRHGTAILERDAGTTARLLVVLSDGFAYDHGYERAYGEADARRALAEARHRGIGSVCLSIGAGTDAAALRRVFGTAAHAAIPRAELLPAVVGPLFRAALRSAQRQRAVHQRRARARERLDLERRTA